MTKFDEAIKIGTLFDSHCHLNALQYIPDIQEVVSRLEGSNVEFVIDMSTDLNSCRNSLELSKKYPGKIYSALGIDPEVFIPGSELFDPNFDIEFGIEILDDLIENNSDQVMMVGETGMDNYWLEKMDKIDNEKMKIANFTKEDSHEKQQYLFEEHIKLSKKHNLPLSIHSRGMVDDCIIFLERIGGASGVFHSLTNDYPDEEGFYDQVKKILEMGFYIGLNGIITYKSAELMRNVFKKVFSEKWKGESRKAGKGLTKQEFLRTLYEAGFVLETDGPFLVPSNYEPHNKRRNEPDAIDNILEYLYKFMIGD